MKTLIALLLTTVTTSADVYMSVTPEQYGAAGNCNPGGDPADDTGAFMSMRTALLNFQNANPSTPARVTVELAPGKCYAYTDNHWTWSLKWLTIHGNGAALMNYYPAVHVRLVLAGNFIPGNQYTIYQTAEPVGGTPTDFTTIGAANNIAYVAPDPDTPSLTTATAGTTFTATGPGTGTGSAQPVTNTGEGANYTWGINGRMVYPFTGGAYAGTLALGGGPYRAYPFHSNVSMTQCDTLEGGVCITPAGPNIADTSAGDTQVRTLNASAADPAIFVPGSWTLLTSYAQQIGNSFPMSARWVDYARVVSANPSTGIITLDRALQNAHKSHFPVDCYPNSWTAGCNGTGPAQILPSAKTTIPFGEQLTIENLNIALNPNAGRVGDQDGYPGDRFYFRSHNYFWIGGYYSATIRNVTALMALVPSVVNDVNIYNSTFALTEVDKIINVLNLTNVNFIGNNFSGCPSNAASNITGGMVLTGWLTGQAVQCTRTSTFNGVYMASPRGRAYATINLNTSYPGDIMTINGSLLAGALGTSSPTYAPYASVQSVTLDGALYSMSGANVVHLTNIQPSPAAGNAANIFLRCTYEGRPISYLHNADGKTYSGTLSQIATDGATGALLTITATTGPAIANGDTISCASWQPGSVALNPNNVYLNYGQAATVP
jgi:hypothetical protein